MLICAAVLVSTAAFAQDADAPAAKPAKAGLPIPMSAGIGAVFGYSANSGSFVGKVQGAKIYTVDQVGIVAPGVYAFFDATYAEFSVDALFTGSTTERRTRHMDTGKRTETINEDAVLLKFALLGKYPFALGPFSLFPLLGIDYTLDFGSIDNSKLGFAAGCGFDVPLSVFNKTKPILDKLYLRVEALYGLQLKSTEQLDAETAWTDQDSITGYSNLKADAGVTHGPQLKVAVGYKF
jgi:opacity protein-like surface antigen